mmetsp:Transcript_18583/g.40673  ORF Transcript_18583/g.40673 Transcript_18583/m.40673 type:complete len:569 (+) Transcript_18583:82-1788(+)
MFSTHHRIIRLVWACGCRAGWLRLGIAALRVSLGLVEGARDHLQLLRPAQPVEHHRIPANADGELWVVLRVLHGVHQQLTVQHVHVQVLATLREVAIQQRRHVRRLVLLGLAQRGRGDGEGVGHAVHAVLVLHLGHRVEGGKSAGAVAAVARVGARSIRLMNGAPVGGGASLLAVHDVASDGQDRHSVLSSAVGGGAAQGSNQLLTHPLRPLVSAVIIIAVGGGDAALRCVEADGKPGLRVADRGHLVELNGGERVSNDGEPRNAESHQAVHVCVMQCHLQALVVVLVVHEVDHVHGVDIQLCKPVNGLLKAGHDFVDVQRAVAGGGQAPLRAHLGAGHLITAVVKGVEQQLGAVAARAEQLHLLASAHGADTACNADVLPKALAGHHQGVVLVLQAAGGTGHVAAVLLEGLGELLVPQDSEVRLGGGAQVGQGMDDAVAGLGDQAGASLGAATDGGSHPGGISGKDLVIRIRAQVAHKPQLHHKVINHLLGVSLCDRAGSEILLNVNIKEAVHTAQGHGCAILLLHSRKVSEVGPLDGLLGSLRRAAHVEAVHVAQLLELVEGLDLL